MRYVGFDLETTGVDPFNDVPVSAAFVERLAHPDGRVENVHTELLINPGRPIPDGASEVHGIRDADVADANPLEGAIAGISTRLVQLFDEGAVIVGSNVSYDLTMIDACRRRQGLGALRIGRVMDVLVIDRQMDKWRRGPRRLSNLYTHYVGGQLDGAHGASADALGALMVLAAQGAKWPFLQKIAYDPTATLAAWHRTWLTGFSEYLVKKGEPPPGPGRYNWPVHTDDTIEVASAL